MDEIPESEEDPDAPDEEFVGHRDDVASPVPVSVPPPARNVKFHFGENTEGVPHAAGVPGERDFHPERLPVPVLPRVVKSAERIRLEQAAEVAGKVPAAQVRQRAPQLGPSDEGVANGRQRAGAVRSIPAQVSSATQALSQNIQSSAQRRKDREREGRSNTSRSQILESTFAEAAGATAVSATATGGRGQSQPPSAPAELMSEIAIAESMLAQSSKGRRSSSGGRARREAVAEAEEIVKKAGQRKGAAAQAEAQHASAQRTKLRNIAGIAAVTAVGVGAGVFQGRGRGPPAGGGFHMRDVIRPATPRFAN